MMKTNPQHKEISKWEASTAAMFQVMQNLYSAIGFNVLESVPCIQSSIYITKAGSL